MRENSNGRAVILGEYILDTGSTVRAAAKVFKISKSTVHKDMTQKLFHYDTAMYAAVRTVLEENKAERHLRGGEATKQKYLQKKFLLLCCLVLLMLQYLHWQEP